MIEPAGQLGFDKSGSNNVINKLNGTAKIYMKTRSEDSLSFEKDRKQNEDSVF